jgi:hypothetical protein
VNARNDGRRRVYRLDLEALAPVHDWVTELERTWTTRFARLDVVLAELDAQERRGGA